MQPLKITIWGDFWDCQIYMGRLYLWKLDGALCVYNWDDILNTFIISPEDKLVLLCGFDLGQPILILKLHMVQNCGAI